MRFGAVWGAFAAIAAGGMAFLGSSEPITYSEHIAPILEANCVTCHRMGGAAPFALTTYEDVQSRASLIAEVTASRYMPPWLPERGLVRYAGERGLTQEQIGLIQAWVGDGAPEGGPGTSARTAPPSGEWGLGEPDVIVEFEPYLTPAEGHDVYRNLVARIPITTPGYVSAIDVRPGDPRVVHHARVMVDTTASSREVDAQDSTVGFDGMDLVSNATNPDGFFVGWTPGHVPRRASGDLGWPIRPGMDLVIQLHVRPDGQARTVQPRIGLYLLDGEPKRRPALIMLGSETIDIPAGDAAYVVADSFELPVDVRALGVYPHAHYLGQKMEGFARLPSGRTQWLIRINDWDFNWQDEYHFAEPIRLPRGSMVTMRYTYDNSADNPQNPFQPPRRVRFGPNSTDEMADLVVQVVPENARDRAALVEDLNWKYYSAEMLRLATAARWSGDSLAALGRWDEALSSYRESLQYEADDPRVLAAMAAVVLQQGDVESARFIAERAATLTEYQDARVLLVLARVLAAVGAGPTALQAAEQALAIAEAGDDASLVREARALVAELRRSRDGA